MNVLLQTIVFTLFIVMVASCQNTDALENEFIQKTIDNMSSKADCDLTYEESQLSPNSKKKNLVVTHHCDELTQLKPSLIALELMSNLKNKGTVYNEYHIVPEISTGKGYSYEQLESVEEHKSFAMSCFKSIGKGKIEELEDDLDQTRFKMDYFELLKEYSLENWVGEAKFYDFEFAQHGNLSLLRVDAKFKTGYCSLVIDLASGKIANIQ